MRDVLRRSEQGSAANRGTDIRVAIGGVMLAAIVGIAVCAPLVATYDPGFIPRGEARLSPSWNHWFGTDEIGRDVFSRVVYGARSSLLVGFGATAIAGAIGIVVGAVAGYRGGVIDSLLMRLTDMFLIFPAVLLASALTLVLGRGVGTLVIVLGIVGWPVIARVTRATVTEVSQQGWVEAAIAIGCSEYRVLTRHVLPHALAPIVAVTILYVATAILGEATLSFLAIGITDPTPSWGSMIAGGRRTLATDPHIVLFPIAALFLTVSALLTLASGSRSMLGDRR